MRSKVNVSPREEDVGLLLVSSMIKVLWWRKGGVFHGGIESKFGDGSRSVSPHLRKEIPMVYGSHIIQVKLFQHCIHVEPTPHNP